MTDLGAPKIILVVRPTRLDELVTRFNTVQQAQFYIEHLGADFSDYLLEHQHYRQAADQAETALREVARVQRLERKFLPNFVFGPTDTAESQLNDPSTSQKSSIARVLLWMRGFRSHRH